MTMREVGGIAVTILFLPVYVAIGVYALVERRITMFIDLRNSRAAMRDLPDWPS